MTKCVIINVFNSILFSYMGKLRYSKNQKNQHLLINIGLVLKELRISKEVSQMDVYSDTNVHIGRIESCKSNFNITTLFVLLKYFNISLSEFFRMVEKREK